MFKFKATTNPIYTAAYEAYAYEDNTSTIIKYNIKIILDLIKTFSLPAKSKSC